MLVLFFFYLIIWFIRCFLYGIFVVYLDKIELIKEEVILYVWWCCCLVKDIFYIIGYVIFKIILKMIGIMFLGILFWFIVDNIYVVVINVKEVMKCFLFISNCVY